MGGRDSGRLSKREAISCEKWWAEDFHIIPFFFPSVSSSFPLLLPKICSNQNDANKRPLISPVSAIFGRSKLRKWDKRIHSLKGFNRDARHHWKKILLYVVCFIWSIWLNTNRVSLLALACVTVKKKKKKHVKGKILWRYFSDFRQFV